MANRWIEKVLGPLEQKRRYRQYKVRTGRLPASYRTALEALQRYMSIFGPGKGHSVLAMLDDLADLFEQGAANRTPIRDIVVDDPVEFAEAFLRNYPEGSWVGRERERLSSAVERAAGEVARNQGTSR